MRVGDQLPDLVRQLSITDLVAYAAATWDWHRLHYDSGYVAERGFEAPVVDGQMFGALLADQAMTFAGPRATIRRLHFRNRSPVLVGDEIRCVGVVASVDEAMATIDQQVFAGDRLVVGPAGTVLTLGESRAGP
jgi:hydroxyacyl-ACP dehydratase HTD2-like protein with hotdog domain